MMQHEVTADLLTTRQEDGHLLPADHTRPKPWIRGTIIGFVLVAAAGFPPSAGPLDKRQGAQPHLHLRETTGHVSTWHLGPTDPETQTWQVPAFCLLGLCHGCAVSACLSPVAGGSVAMCLEGLPGGRAQLPACWSPSVS